MRSSKLKYPIVIEQATASRDSYGEPVQTWETYSNVWADIQPLRGREFYDAQQVNAELTKKITVRLDEDISPQMRVSYDSRYMDIQSVRHFHDYQETVLLCREWDE